jgi:hypothetical protein
VEVGEDRREVACWGRRQKTYIGNGHFGAGTLSEILHHVDD